MCVCVRELVVASVGGEEGGERGAQILSTIETRQTSAFCPFRFSVENWETGLRVLPTLSSHRFHLFFLVRIILLQTRLHTLRLS